MASPHSTTEDGQETADGVEAMDETTWVFEPQVQPITEPMLEPLNADGARTEQDAEHDGGALQKSSCSTGAANEDSGQADATSTEGDAAWILEPAEKQGDLEPGSKSSQVGNSASCIAEEECSDGQFRENLDQLSIPQPTTERFGDEDSTLDESSFRHFAPLLKASQAYAALSGCRFRSNSFDGLTEVSERDATPRVAAKISAAATVRDFTSRLLADEAGLVEELERAHRIVMSESVRNLMIGTCQEYNMFPPYPPPDGIEDEDCAYQDTSATFPAIAQRLYNDQVHRLCSEGSDSASPHSCRLQQRAMTAAFIVDFAQDAGVVIPPMPEVYDAMISEFSLRTAAWADASGSSRNNPTNTSGERSSILTEGSATAERWFPEFSSRKHQHPLLYAAGAVALGAAAVASTTLGRRVRV